MDNEEIFTTSFPAGRKQIFVDVKENNIGKYLKIKERGDSQNNSIIIPAGSIVQLRNALDEAVQALGALDTGEGGGAAGAPPNQCVCHVGNLSLPMVTSIIEFTLLSTQKESRPNTNEAPERAQNSRGSARL
jgi:hypothetical protein